MKTKLILLALLSPMLLWPQAMEQEISSPLSGLFPFLLCPPCPPATRQQVQPSQNAEEMLKEFFSFNPDNKKLLAVLEKGAVEPFKTRLIKKFMAQRPSPEEAARLLAQNPPEPYAGQVWQIVDSDGTLRDKCYVQNHGSPEYQDKAFASIRGRTLLVEEYIFYLMQEKMPQRFVKPTWDGFSKLNPGKEGFLLAAKDAKGDFQEIAILQLLSSASELNLSYSDVSELQDLISKVNDRVNDEKKKEREEKLIKAITQKKCNQ